MKKKYLNYLLTSLLLCCTVVVSGQTLSQTYSSGDIPTSYNSYDPTCNGPGTTLSLALPATGAAAWEVTSVDVVYDMTAQNIAYMSEQRSQIHFQNTNATESSVASGSGSSGGTFSYSRSLSLANGYYAAGTDLIFEMQAWRTWGSTSPNDGCGIYYNKVDDGTWMITVNYQAAPTCLAPTNVQVGNETQTSVDVTWTEMGNSTDWEIEYGAPGFSLGSGTTINVATNPAATINSLTTDTDYELYIKSICGGGDESNFIGPISFGTTPDCSAVNLSLSNPVGQTVQCIGTADLEVTPSGNGDYVFWYDAAAGGNLIGVGNTFTTPEITTTTSYWATEVFTEGDTETGIGKTVPDFSGSYGSTLNYGLEFDANLSFTIQSVEVYPDDSGDLEVSLLDNSGNVIASTTQSVSGDGTTAVLVPLNFNVPIGTGYRLEQTSSPSLDLIRDYSATNNFPYDIGPSGLYGSIIGGCYGTSATSTSYYYFYNWTVTTASVVCESPREEVVATVSTAGDVTINSLPYNTTDDTANYGSPFSGSPGTDCGITENYLNGNNVVYKFTAANTELVDILLSDLDDFYSAVFVYDSCGDVGTSCLAGAVAGPSDADYGITEFPVTAGEDYYVVVSSWLTPTFDYTLDIVPFTCADLEEPTANSPQDFVGGDVVSDLEVETTRPNATLNYYTDAQGNNPVLGTDNLVDGTTYYVTQTFNGCESAPVSVTVDEIDCSSLAITSTIGATVTCKGEMTLEATASGTGSDIYWYDAASGGDIVAIGSTFTTPELTSTTSYWAAEVSATGTTASLGPVDPSMGTTSSSTIDIGTQQLFFEVTAQTTILSVDVYPNSSIGATSGIEIRDSNGTVATIPYTVQVTGGNLPQTVPLNVTLGPGSYEMGQEDGNATSLTRNTSGASYPYISPELEITGNSFDVGYYYFFYNWAVSSGEFICESPREEVVATVNQTGDVSVAYTDLPYTDTNSTSIYGNNFEGDPGSSCPGSGILDGNDVVYEYTADGSNDDILNIELSGITNPDTGMYIYESCGEVGGNCLEGVINDGSSSMSIEDYYVNAGDTFFIVISSSNSTTNYTLDIYGIDCNDIEAPTTNDVTPYFVSGDVVSDLDVEANVYNDGLTWYSDAALTNEIVDPSTEALVDGMTYYVTQTILGCEGAALEITPEEFDCTAMSVTAEDAYICYTDTEVQLQATPSGIGYGVFWYDAATGGDIVASGENPVVNVTQTTSFWVAEVYLGSDFSSGAVNNTYCIPNYTYPCSSNDLIEDFIMLDAGINHLGSGCSPNNYGDFTNDPNLVGTMSIGVTYDFTVVHDPAWSQGVKIWIDLNQDGDFEDVNELLYTSSGTATTHTGSITIPAANGGATVMRVMDRFSGIPVDSCTPGSGYGEVHDYKVIIGDILCESAREEVVVNVNTTPTSTPTGNAQQAFCVGNQVIDLQANGNDIIWYASESTTTPLSPNTELIDGETYYASQTVNACESVDRLAVTVTVNQVPDAPLGDENQGFEEGDVVADLEAQGDNLTWYVYENFEYIEIDPSTETLEDQETYYVTQTPPGLCESDFLEITVHVTQLNIDNPIFNNLVYYPNPAKDYLIISNSVSIERYEVYNLLGQKIMASTVNSNETRIITSGLSSGAYMVKVTIGDNTAVFKVMKE